MRTTIFAALALTALMLLTGVAQAAPTASYTTAPAGPPWYTGEQMTFDGSASVCDVAPCTYNWADDGGDGAGGTQWPLGTGQSINFTFQNPGTKRVRLTVTNASGQTATVMWAHTLTAGPRPTPPPPVACNDTVDNDADGLVDLADPECSSSTDTDETNVVVPPPTGNCDRNATPSTFASQVSAATAGQTICLASGSYGTWSGTNKQITVRKADGATPTMRISFGSGDTGFTLDGMSSMGGSVSSGASNITVRNSAFNSELRVTGTLPAANIVFDANTHNNISGNSTAHRILLDGAATISNSLLQGGGSDGIRVGNGRGSLIVGNTILNVLGDSSSNHTDMLQVYGSGFATVRGNLFKQTVSGEVQVIGAYDGVANMVIEDNVFDVTARIHSIELYSDANSIVRHNTLVYRSPCAYSQPCGGIDLNRKSVNDAGFGTQVYDNIATSIDLNSGSTAARRDHNMVRRFLRTGDFLGTPVYVGGSNPSTYAGYALAPGSPGKGAASDGLDVGIRAS